MPLSSRFRQWAAAVAVGLLIVSAAACSSDSTGAATDGSTSTASTPAARTTGAGMVEATFVDTSRTTPRSRDLPAQPQRTLATTIYYPTASGGPGELVEGAVPDTSGGPYPLLVFAHGLGANPTYYEDILREVAASGFVVVAPAFPLTSSQNPGGPDAGDTGNQPGDVSFLVDTATSGTTPEWSDLAGLVDPERVGAFGHSNGAITTLGLTANSCCRDDRVDAAVVLSGTPSPFGGGEYEFAEAPPTLLIHGTDDRQVAYEGAQSVFNDLDGPKGLLTLDGVDHVGFITAGTPAHATTTSTIIDFFRAELLGDEAALGRLATGPQSEGATLVFVAERGTGTTVSTVAPRTGRSASVDVATGLRGGQVVTVSWSGFTPGKVVNIVQCSQGGNGGNDVCDLTKAQILQPDPTGEGSLPLEIIVGAVGSGRCDSSTTDCVIVVNDGGLPDPDATVRIPISFSG